MKTPAVLSLALSRDDRWIAAGTVWEGVTIVWDATTYEQVIAQKGNPFGIHGVDFSPNSSLLVSASCDRTVTIWDVALRSVRTHVQTLDRHVSTSEDLVKAAKYSPHGDRFATATGDSVRVWDSDDGHLLVDINVTVNPKYNTGLLWFGNNHLLVISDGKIKEFEASTGSAVSEWPVPPAGHHSCIVLPKYGQFIAYSTTSTITFWDTSTHTQLGLIQHPQDISSIALSHDDQSLAIGDVSGKITIRNLSRITEPDVQINDAVLNLWNQDQLANTDALLTAAIPDSQNPSHHALASRALVRARLQQWDVALVDAEMAIKIQPTVISFIAKSIAHLGMGEKHEAYQACDIAFERFHSAHGNFILLIKAIIVFMAGEHRDAISRLDDLIATVDLNSICYVVQTYIYILLGDSQVESGDFTAAIQSFERARAQMRHHTSRTLLLVSLISGWRFNDFGMSIRRRLCEALYTASRIKDAVQCFHQMKIELGEETYLHDEHLKWALDFSQLCFKKLEHLGDTAVDAQQYDDAISYYTTALSLNRPSPQGVLIKRRKAFLVTRSWKQALDDADQVIALAPASPWGYEIKHAALHNIGDYVNAVDAFEVMLSKIAKSLDVDVQQYGDRYITPSSTRATIRKTVQQTIRHSPRVLINATTGRLLDRAEQASAFESLPIFNELVSSMTTRIDYVRIKREVRQYFRYVMLSHRWEENEPLFQQVMHITVYDLDKSPTHDKLQMFCKIVRDAGFDWAWSDTCCINKSDHFVLQEALVAMFKWYQGCAMMIVFLRGVRSSSQLGALVKSIWNTRAWTLQEYVASKIIHFYTEDWTLYLDLQLPNHKESPEVISEMEQATGVSAQQLMALRPGLTSIREKLRLASTRQTTLVEDAAYSLLGIFSVTGVPAIYGEGEAALGRLLAHVLAGSGDASILAWTGESGSFNSCLPAHITVFSGPATSHLPPPIPDAETERIITPSHTSPFNLDVALQLYDRLSELPAPWFAASRMKLPCIAFELPTLSPYRTRSGYVHRADTVAFGMVEIKTRYDLTRVKPLYLVHPWLDTLLEREDKSHVIIQEDIVPPPSPHTDDEEISDKEIDDDEEFFDANDYFSSLTEPVPPPQAAPARMVPTDREMRARRLVSRLRQPFGALLVTLASTGGRAVDYKRVAAESMITVQFQENVSLADLLDNVRTLDIL
ncbi:WD40 repeat-like protein [Imleria badia]|nr:WD40 repeat-like protein [Imleria badia]